MKDNIRDLRISIKLVISTIRYIAKNSLYENTTYCKKNLLITYYYTIFDPSTATLCKRYYIREKRDIVESFNCLLKNSLLLNLYQIPAVFLIDGIAVI